MGGNRRTNKAHNPMLAVNAPWFTTARKRNRKRDKMAKASRRKNR